MKQVEKDSLITLKFIIRTIVNVMEFPLVHRNNTLDILVSKIQYKIFSWG